MEYTYLAVATLLLLALAISLITHEIREDGLWMTAMYRTMFGTIATIFFVFFQSKTMGHSMDAGLHTFTLLAGTGIFTAILVALAIGTDEVAEVIILGTAIGGCACGMGEVLR